MERPFLGDPAPGTIGVDIQRLRAALDARKARIEREGRPVELGDVLEELRTLNNTINERLRPDFNRLSPA